MDAITVAIDGYSSCGKSTLAKSLAVKLGYSYIDTGAMYRATTLYLIRQGLHPSQENFQQKVIEQLKNIHLTFKYNASSKSSDTYLNKENVEVEIRQMSVSNMVSDVSIIKEVRDKMVAIQKKLGKDKGVVMEGRDIGTNVFPDAELKLFMTADIEIRMQRRYDELHSKGMLVSMEEVKQNLESRDYQDTHRKENPLIKAEDAIILDNSDLSRQEQLEYVLKIIENLDLLKE
jgi:CMP/dCMP kinase